MRALFSVFILMALVFGPYLNAHSPTNSLTTSVSAWVAPYLGTPSGYVRPSIAQTVTDNQQLISTLSHTYNHSQLSGMSDAEFATVMVAILYTEQLGWLEDVFPAIRTITPWYQDLQVHSNEWFGTNFSVWPANLRPSVVDEILTERALHTFPGSISLVHQHTIHQAPAYTRLATNPQTALELLAANLERGIYRAAAAGVTVNSQTLYAWHNAGVVDPHIIRSSPALQQYVERATVYQSRASSLFMVATICPNPSFATVAQRQIKQ